jgi:multicomponent Na+:H+ antiporter subunit E
VIGQRERARWQRRALYVLGLTVAWVMLWDQIDVANAAAGLLVATGMLVVFPLPASREPRLTLRPLAFARLAAGILGHLVTSNILVSREVISKNSRLRTGIVAVRMRTRSPKLLSTVANILALSPGSMAVAASDRPPTIYVHVLALGDVVDFRRRVARLERQVVAAFGSEHDRRAMLEIPDDAVAGA